MKNRNVPFLLVLFALILPLFTGCASSMQARSVDTTTSFLVNPKMLEKGGPDQSLYRYINPKTDWKKYDKIIIDPVLIYREGELSPAERENFQKLAHNFQLYLVEELGKDLKVVKDPQPGTMRLTAAIVSANPTAVVRNVLTTVVPVGMAISTVQYAATGKPSSTGDITSEARVTDAVSDELLGMGVDKRVGGKSLSGMTESWYSADEGAKAIAKLIRYNECRLIKGAIPECEAVKPK